MVHVKPVEEGTALHCRAQPVQPTALAYTVPQDVLLGRACIRM